MKIIQTADAPAAVGAYSQAICADNTLFSAGQIAINPANGKLEGDISSQTAQVCKNLGAILAAAGFSFADVVKTSCFLADINDFAAFNSVYEKFFITKPARSCVAVKALPKGALCEIELIAVHDSR